MNRVLMVDTPTLLMVFGMIAFAVVYIGVGLPRRSGHDQSPP